MKKTRLNQIEEQNQRVKSTIKVQAVTRSRGIAKMNRKFKSRKRTEFKRWIT